MPLANAYLDPAPSYPADRRYPLKVVVCCNCWLVSLDHIVDPEIPYRDYFYVSSDSVTMTGHRGISPALASGSSRSPQVRWWSSSRPAGDTAARGVVASRDPAITEQGLVLGQHQALLRAAIGKIVPAARAVSPPRHPPWSLRSSDEPVDISVPVRYFT